MRRLVMACLVTLVLSVAGTVAAVEYLRGGAIETPYFIPRTMDSAVLGETRELLIHLPESYHREPARRYGVVYVLDGSSLDGPTADAAALLARVGLTPELIVVGLPNVSGPGRQRDYTPPFMRQDLEAGDALMGQADRFLDFVEREVIPAVARDYRTTDERLLSGHSRGGLLVAYALMARPRLFDGFLAHSPALWRDDGIMVSRLAEWLESGASPEAFLYLSIGSDEVSHMMAGFNGLRDALGRHAAKAGLRWRADVTAGADHRSNGPRAAGPGLAAYFVPPSRLTAAAR